MRKLSSKKTLLFSAIQPPSVLAGHPEVPHPSPEERGHLCHICADGVHHARCHSVPGHHSCSVGDTQLPLSSPVLRGFWHHQSLDGRIPLHVWGPSAEVTPLLLLCSPQLGERHKALEGWLRLQSCLVPRHSPQVLPRPVGLTPF